MWLSASCSPEGVYGEGDPVVSGALEQTCPGTTVSLQFMRIQLLQALRRQGSGQGRVVGGLRAQKVKHWSPSGLGPPGHTVEALQVELLSPCRPSCHCHSHSHGPLPKGQLLVPPLPSWWKHSVSPHILQERFLALWQPLPAGLSWEVFPSQARSLCRMTPPPTGTRENPDSSLVCAYEMMILKL